MTEEELKRDDELGPLLMEKMDEYKARFGEHIFRMETSNAETIVLIDECLATGKPFDPYFGGEIPADAVF